MTHILGDLVLAVGERPQFFVMRTYVSVSMICVPPEEGIQGRTKQMSDVICELVLEVTRQHFNHILLVRSESLSLGPSPGGGC